MILAESYINDNGISAVALAFFTALFGMVATITVAVIKQRGDVKETKISTLSTGALVERKLDILARNHDRLETQIDGLEKSVRDHIEWHLKKEDDNNDHQRGSQERYFGRAQRR